VTDAVAASEEIDTERYHRHDVAEYNADPNIVPVMTDAGRASIE